MNGITHSPSILIPHVERESAPRVTEEEKSESAPPPPQPKEQRSRAMHLIPRHPASSQFGKIFKQPPAPQKAHVIPSVGKDIVLPKKIAEEAPPEDLKIKEIKQKALDQIRLAYEAVQQKQTSKANEYLGLVNVFAKQLDDQTYRAFSIEAGGLFCDLKWFFSGFLNFKNSILYFRFNHPSEITPYLQTILPHLQKYLDVHSGIKCYVDLAATMVETRPLQSGYLIELMLSALSAKGEKGSPNGTYSACEAHLTEVGSLVKASNYDLRRINWDLWIILIHLEEYRLAQSCARICFNPEEPFTAEQKAYYLKLLPKALNTLPKVPRFADRIAYLTRLILTSPQGETLDGAVFYAHWVLTSFLVESYEVEPNYDVDICEDFRSEGIYSLVEALKRLGTFEGLDFGSLNVVCKMKNCSSLFELKSLREYLATIDPETLTPEKRGMYLYILSKILVAGSTFIPSFDVQRESALVASSYLHEARSLNCKDPALNLRIDEFIAYLKILPKPDNPLFYHPDSIGSDDSPETIRLPPLREEPASEEEIEKKMAQLQKLRLVIPENDDPTIDRVYPEKILDQ